MSIIRKSSIVLAIVGSASALGGCALAADESKIDEAANLGESDSALCKNALSAAEERTALKLIDDICGDTWCEGDNNFAFEKLTCRGGSCTLRLAIIPREDDPPTYDRSCTTRGFSGFSSLVQTAPNDYQSLQPTFYDALSACINRLEDALP